MPSSAEAEIREEELHQQRRALEQLHVARHAVLRASAAARARDSSSAEPDEAAADEGDRATAAIVQRAASSRLRRMSQRVKSTIAARPSRPKMNRGPAQSSRRRSADGQQQVDRRGDDERLEGAEVAARDQVGRVRELLGRDLAAHGRAEHHDDDLARPAPARPCCSAGGSTTRRNTCDSRQRQAARRLDLPARRGLDAGADDLGRVGAEVDHHREHRGAASGESLMPSRRQAEEDEEQLHDERRVADQLDVGADHRTQPASARAARAQAQATPSSHADARRRRR